MILQFGRLTVASDMATWIRFHLEPPASGAGFAAPRGCVEPLAHSRETQRRSAQDPGSGDPTAARPGCM